MHGFFPFYFDPTYLLLVPALIISFWAQTKVSSAYDKYSRIRTMNGYTGEQIARMMLNEAGLYDIPIEVVNTRLGDHYDPTSRILRLSQEVYVGTTIASAGIAAHEVGHAIQHKESYGPLTFRNTIYPVVNLGSTFSWVLLVAGLILAIKPLVYFGIILFSAVVLFQLVTLPVEFNASNRALNILNSRGILYGDEVKGAEKVLNAAAMTYVAATIMSVSQLIRLVLISRSNE
ncbi:zinc metallopeptidase [Clostridium sp. SHJSY1]|uniref:zinc metallopeptidase n=1 Tax=Clostridium sp. SHJSY1 TaxID=2942483 RepID=UPI0028746DEB|nr:zinc metallopeptidase [Clostridium sp. SHJSY1]MDS0524944.1 zinc metallopeptidase [Clostridium sp. SHJSY1]